MRLSLDCRPKIVRPIRFAFFLLVSSLARGRKDFLFIIKRAVQLPPTSSAGSRTVQHVLIFDDHPESLRLVFGGAAAQVDLSRLPGASSRHLVLLSILIMGLLSAILWLFF